ncbi:ectonucleoside triphosphate diphosphohydrolase 5/6 [Nematocida homosporus]|uniref:ectonucleoside triphosphate diphosphohydrolase 5/6 n=1 Tax=Nematocida homosporus TaxID=1912981 RepID=UPI0022201BA2|nr:ectonucleoside triphosphate diphosphohydrolase 5/6 [Nematocida homosporus]KAI5186581.1 ectonucleoside triphosphate diphosphohydrolase 5/6 [Nematocida homosporus]
MQVWVRIGFGWLSLGLVFSVGIGGGVVQAQKNELQLELQENIEALGSEISRLQRVQKGLQLIYEKIGVKEGLSKPGQNQDQFVAVFDGGSTGTRLNIYRFDAKGLELKKHVLESVSPGIHQSASPMKDIETLLARGRSFLASQGHSEQYDFPVVFNGTAGLRLVELKHRERVLAEVKEALVKATKKKDIEVRVIDGKEEGFYAWAALAFATKSKDKIAIIDLGGGSAQISFEIDRDLQSSQDGIVEGKKKKVLSKSFLGLGLVAGLEQVHRLDTQQVCAWGEKTFELTACKRHMKASLSSMILEKTGGKEIAPGISQVSTVFVSSFISEILHEFNTPSNIQFKDIKSLVDSVCVVKKSGATGLELALSPMSAQAVPTVSTPPPSLKCPTVIYASMFMENLGVGLFTPIKDASLIPVDISWSLGRALSLIE